MTESFVCLYCGYPHATEQATLEHAIPQSLGGAHAPDRLKLRNVCKKCNNDLGAFVDASFAKSWFVTNGLATAAHKLSRPRSRLAIEPMKASSSPRSWVSLPTSTDCQNNLNHACRH